MTVDAETRKDFAALGVTIPFEPDEEPEFIPIMQCNWPSFRAFTACATQWQVAPLPSGRLLFSGLDYAGCDVVLRNQQAGPHAFEELQAMEDAALEVFNEAD